MADGRQGRYRTVTPHGPQYAWVATGDAGGEDVTEAEYRGSGLEPPFENLPLKEDYEVASLPDDASDGQAGA